jgi:hypothetical protein
MGTHHQAQHKCFVKSSGNFDSVIIFPQQVNKGWIKPQSIRGKKRLFSLYLKIRSIPVSTAPSPKKQKQH